MTLAGLLITDWLQLLALLGVTLAFAYPLGMYMADVYEGEHTFLHPILGPLERAMMWLMRVQPHQVMTWKEYTAHFLTFSFVCGAALLIQLLVQKYPSVSPDLAINITLSFISGTQWQSAAPETSIALFTQLTGLTVQSVLSAATGLCVMIALIRGLTRSERKDIGHFWVDLIRGLVYVLLPLCFLLAVFLVSQGCVQTFGETLSFLSLDDATPHSVMTGPVASSAAIKQLGTNGGGYFLANAAHPFENPTPLSNFIQIVAMLLLPAASLFCFGKMAGSMKQASIILAVTLFFFLVPAISTTLLETAHGPNWEGKEVRFGIAGATLWTTASTATSGGATNAAIDSFHPLSSMQYMLLIQAGEIFFGGVGTGLACMLVFVLLAVLISGLLIGRTPKYLGKTVGVFEIKMASIIILIPAFMTMLGAAIAVSVSVGTEGLTAHGAHALSQILYAFTSVSNTNGSAMAGLNVNTPFYNLITMLAILLGRFGAMTCMLAIAGSMAEKQKTISNATALNTTTFVFFCALCAIIIINVMPYFPAIVLGPVAESFHLAPEGTWP